MYVTRQISHFLFNIYYKNDIIISVKKLKDIAYIVIHGFGGTPKDILSIKNELIKNGINEEDIFTPLLKGHGIKGKIKIGTKYEDIINDLEKYIMKNCGEYKKKYVFGYSMGGLVSLGLATNMKIDKLVLFNAPMHIWNFKNFVWTIYTKNPKQKIYHIKTVLSSFKYSKIVNSMELRRLQAYVRANLDRVKADTYIIQSKHDYVATPTSANEIYDKIGAVQKSIKWYDEMTHYIPNEEKIGEVVSDTVEWIKI